MNIRGVNLTDARELTKLSSQHGYEISVADVQKNLEILLENKDHAIFVIEIDGEIAGWVHIHGRYLIDIAPFAEIGGLVVDENHRRLGYGKILMCKSEAWARENSYHEIRLRSGGQRKVAYKFYKSIGYEYEKWQNVFSLRLD